MGDVDQTESKLNVELAPISDLRPYANNPRTHTPRQLRQIADSIIEFGFTNPILTDGEGGVIAGHGRLEAAKLLGLETVPVIRLEEMSEGQKRAYILADNKLAENAGWDRELLAVELQYLIELDFNVDVTGFEMGEIDVLIGGLTEAEGDDADLLPAIKAGEEAVTQPGDLWALGEHRLLCADALDPESYDALLGNEKAEMVITDSPFNVPVDGHVCGRGAIKHKEFAMASGEMSEAEFTSFLRRAMRNLAEASQEGSLHFYFIDWRHIFELLSAGREVFDDLKNIVIWAKSNGGLGSLYRSQHEMIGVFKKGRAAHINNIKLGRFGRNRTNVWQYPGINAFGATRDEELALHPTTKPVALIEDAIKDCSSRGGIVLDAFLGSGTTLIAAERAGRRGFGIEIDPLYVDVTLERYRRTFDVDPIHVGSGLPFSFLK